MMRPVDRLKELANDLKPLLGRGADRVIKEARARLAKPEGEVTEEDLERVLKTVVYPELAKRMSKEEARRRVEELLFRHTKAGLKELEEALREFGLYIDWPEVQRLRRLVGGLKVEWSPEAAAEARAVIKRIREELEDRLVHQARAISELERDYERVKRLDDRRVRRLASLLEQVRQAHEERILAPAEIERARQLASELLKEAEKLAPAEEEEEFVISFDEEERAREDEGRRLENLAKRYRAVLVKSPWAERYRELKARLEAGEVLGDELAAFEEELARGEKELIAESRARYEWIVEKLREAEALGLRKEALWGQLEAVAEDLRQGVVPEGLSELEREAEEVLAEAKARRDAEFKARRLADEAYEFAEQALVHLDAAGYPELEEGLKKLLEQAEAGQVDEALYRWLKAELPKALSGRAEALWARLSSLPRYDDLADRIDEVQEKISAGELEAAEREVAELEAEARRRVAAELEELGKRAERFGVELEGLLEARASLEEGKFPELEGLRRSLEEAISAERRRARAKLARLRSEAERYLGLGGEALLGRIREAEAQLEEGAVPLEELEEELKALEERREAFRRGLRERYHKLVEGYARYKGMTGETRSRLGAMMGFLEEGFSRLDRLGTEGLLELAQALAEAEPLLEQLEREHQAARELASELAGRDVDELLDIFAEESPAEPDPLAEFRRPGVVAVGYLDEDELPLEPEKLSALLERARTPGELELSVFYLPEHVLLVAPGGGRSLYVVAERSLLPQILELVQKKRWQTTG